MAFLYQSPPKQSSEQIMPGQDELRSLHEQLMAIEAALALSPTAQQMLSNPQTDFQCRIRRSLMRLKAARLEVTHARKIVESLCKR
jgi:hypothetical protein